MTQREMSSCERYRKTPLDSQRFTGQNKDPFSFFSSSVFHQINREDSNFLATRVDAGANLGCSLIIRYFLDNLY